MSEDEALFFLAGQEKFTKENFIDHGWPIMSHLVETANTAEPSGEIKESSPADNEDYDYETENENASEDDDERKLPEPVTEKPQTGSFEL